MKKCVRSLSSIMIILALILAISPATLAVETLEDARAVPSISTASLIRMYREGSWNGEPIKAAGTNDVAELSEYGNIVRYKVHSKGFSYEHEYTQIWPAAGATPIRYGVVSEDGEYTLALYGNSLGLYRRNGKLMGARYLGFTTGEHEGMRVHWDSDKAIVSVRTDIFVIDLKLGTVTKRVFPDMLSCYYSILYTDIPGGSDKGIYYLRGNDLWEFTLKNGDRLLCKNCTVFDAIHFTPMVVQAGPYETELGDKLSRAYFDQHFWAFGEEGERDAFALAKRVPIWDYLNT